MVTMNEQEKCQNVKREFEQLKAIRSNWDGIRQEIADYIFPLRENLTGTEQKGQKKGTKIYDGTAVSALNLSTYGIHGNMMSPAMQWFIQRLPGKYKFLEKDPEVRLWLQYLTEGLYSAFQNSNFYSEMIMFLKDGSSFDTASMYIDEDLSNNRLIFHALHPREGFISENKHREIDRFIRLTNYTARQAVQKFGRNNLSKQIQWAYENNPFKTSEFLHSVVPREEYDDRKMGNINKPFASIWIEKTGDKILRESGFDLFPYFVWRYSINGDDVYGSSPAIYSLPEIKSLNAISKSVLGAAQLTVEPPYNIPAEMKGKVRLTPHGMNYYGSDPNRRIYPVNTGITFPIALDREEKKREIIKEHYHVDFFTLLAQSEHQMTVLQVSEIMGEKALILGAVIGGLTSVLDQIIDYVAYLEIKAGRIPPPPDILIYYAGGERIDTVYTGTLAQAQRRLFETQSITRSLEMAFPILQLYPEGADIINATDAVKKILISNGFPEDLLNTPDQIAMIRKSRSDVQAAEGQKQDMERMSEVLKKLAQADKNSGGKMSEQINTLLGGGAQP